MTEALASAPGRSEDELWRATWRSSLRAIDAALAIHAISVREARCRQAGLREEMATLAP